MVPMIEHVDVDTDTGTIAGCYSALCAVPVGKAKELYKIAHLLQTPSVKDVFE